MFGAKYLDLLSMIDKLGDGIQQSDLTLAELGLSRVLTVRLVDLPNKVDVRLGWTS
jgi:hypothetical protein